MVVLVVVVIVWSLWILWPTRAPGPAHTFRFGATLPSGAATESAQRDGLAWTALDDRQVARFLASAPRDNDQ